MTDSTHRPSYVVCIKRGEEDLDLEVRKLYERLPDEDAESHGMYRILDESGEDYLYPQSFFVPIEAPDRLREALLAG